MSSTYIPELTITNPLGHTFNVRVVQKGDAYGLKDCLIHNEDRPMVEFYVAQYADEYWPRGQFASRYYVETFATVRDGLCLDGGIREWDLSYENVAAVRKYLADKNLV